MMWWGLGSCGAITRGLPSLTASTKKRRSCGKTWDHVDRFVTHDFPHKHYFLVYAVRLGILRVAAQPIFPSLAAWALFFVDAVRHGIMRSGYPRSSKSRRINKKMMLMWWDMGSCGIKEVMKNFRRCLNWKKNLSTSREANFTVDFLALRKWKGIFILVYVEWFF